MISCGNCKGKHETVADVKACYAGKYKWEQKLFQTVGAAPVAAKAYTGSTRVDTTVAEKATIKLPGMYSRNDRVYRVKRSKGGHLYGQLVTMFDGKPIYTYAPGAVATLCAADKMTIEDAEAFSLKIGHCCCCGKELTNLKSVALGIGPVCRKKYF